MLALSRTSCGESVLAAVLKQDLMAGRTEPERERDEGVWVSVGTEDTMLAAVESAAKEVYAVLGSGLVESCYQRALQIELDLRGFTSELEFPVAVTYKTRYVGFGKVDLLLTKSNTVVELKSVQKLSLSMEAQALAYARSLGSGPGKTALLVNFGPESVEVRSVVV